MSRWQPAIGCATGFLPTKPAARRSSSWVALNRPKNRCGAGGTAPGSTKSARDARYALRMFARTPGFTFVVVFTLALGIGANTAIFGLIDALILRSLPVPRAQELLQVRMRAPGSQGPAGESFSYVIVRALAQQRDIFRSLAGFSTFNFDVGPSGSHDARQRRPRHWRLLRRPWA